MITWTSKSPFAALALLTLSACEGGQGFSRGGSPVAEEKPLRQAILADGAVQVVPPQGYCIDPKSLKSRFALMARCDALGPVPAEDMSGRHWRGTARIGGHIASVTLYGAPKSRAVSEEGRELVAGLIQQSRAKSDGLSAGS